MHTTQRLVGVLRVLLALAFAILLLAQLRLLWATAGGEVWQAPELTGQSWLVTVSLLELLCVQIVLSCTWKLLEMVQDDRIFSEESMVWVDVIVAAMVAGWLLVLGAFVVLVGAGGLTGLSLATLVLMVAGAAVGLLMVVMRALLRQATTLRTELEAVV